MGRKFAVPYCLYRVHGYFNPHLAEQTGFSEEDLDLFKLALSQMFEYDRSAARGEMAPRRCIAFRHESPLGNARADQLFALVKVRPRRSPNDEPKPARAFEDYEVESIDPGHLPTGVSIEEWV